MKKVFISTGVAFVAFFISIMLAMYGSDMLLFSILNILLIVAAVIALFWGIVGKIKSATSEVTSINMLQTFCILLLGMDIYLITLEISSSLPLEENLLGAFFGVLVMSMLLVTTTLEKSKRLSVLSQKGLK